MDDSSANINLTFSSETIPPLRRIANLETIVARINVNTNEIRNKFRETIFKYC